MSAGRDFADRTVISFYRFKELRTEPCWLVPVDAIGHIFSSISHPLLPLPASPAHFLPPPALEQGSSDTSCASEVYTRPDWKGLANLAALRAE